MLLVDSDSLSISLLVGPGDPPTHWGMTTAPLRLPVSSPPGMVVRAKVRTAPARPIGTWTSWAIAIPGVDWEEHDEQSVWVEIDDEQSQEPLGGSPAGAPTGRDACNVVKLRATRSRSRTYGTRLQAPWRAEAVPNGSSAFGEAQSAQPRLLSRSRCKIGGGCSARVGERSAACGSGRLGSAAIVEVEPSGEIGVGFRRCR